jgi:acyl-CoA reductase-like NAD-dependent aldehyde dehydrogenase
MRYIALLAIARCASLPARQKCFERGMDVRLANYVSGSWTVGEGDGTPLLDPTLSTEVARASASGIDYAEALRYAREVGGRRLRGGKEFKPIDADPLVAAMVQPPLLMNKQPRSAQASHEIEVFGPVATLLPYRDIEEALTIAHMGRGSLVASVFSNDLVALEHAALELGRSHGRVLTALQSMHRRAAEFHC